MQNNQNTGQNKKVKMVSASINIETPKREERIDLNNDIYYLMAKENFFYLQNLLHEANKDANNNHSQFSERLFTSATIILGFVPVILSLMGDPITDLQILFLSISIFAAFLSIIFGYLNHYIEKRYWQEMVDMFHKQTRCFDSTLTKMRNEPDKTSQIHREALIYIEGLDQAYTTKSKIWAQIIQFILLVISMLSLIICYLISLPK